MALDSVWGRFVVTVTDPAPESSHDSAWGRAVVSLANPEARFDSAWGHAVIAVGIVVAPIPGVNDVEPETLVTMTAELAGGGTATWAWEQLDGPTVTLTGTGATRAFYAPSLASGGVPAPCTVVLGVTASSGGLTSARRTVTITVLPQLAWYWNGAKWAGKRPLIGL